MEPHNRKDGGIRKPMYAKEEMGRVVRWFFGLPLIFVIYLMFSMAMPVGDVGQRLRIVLNAISYCIFIMVTALVVTRFLRFPFRRMINQGKGFNGRNMAVGLVSMFALGTATTFIWKAFQPERFAYTLQRGWPIDFLLAFILLGLAAFLEEIICRSYIAYFVDDRLEERPRQRLIYCLASAVVFTVFHFRNPEVAGSGAIYAMLFYFVMGFVLMAVTLKTGGIEAALGIHLGNNLVNAWLFTYKDAPLITNALYTHENSIGPMMLVQSVLCLVLSALAVLSCGRRGTEVSRKG